MDRTFDQDPRRSLEAFTWVERLREDAFARSQPTLTAGAARMIDFARKADRGLLSEEELLAEAMAAIEEVFRLGWKLGAAPLEMLMGRACTEMAAEGGLPAGDRGA